MKLSTLYKLAKKSIEEEKQRTAGELMAEDLLRILGKIANQDAGTIKWIEYEVDEEMIRADCNQSEAFEIKMLMNLSLYMYELVKSKKIQIEQRKRQEV